MLTMYKTFQIKHLAGTSRPNGNARTFFLQLNLNHRTKLDQLRAKEQILHPRLNVISQQYLNFWSEQKMLELSKVAPFFLQLNHVGQHQICNVQINEKITHPVFNVICQLRIRASKLKTELELLICTENATASQKAPLFSYS